MSQTSTPPTPAGWYPDPDGSGGRRYWDGTTWTDTRIAPPSDAAARHASPEPAAGTSNRTAFLLFGGSVVFVVAVLAAAVLLVTKLVLGSHNSAGTTGSTTAVASATGSTTPPNPTVVSGPTTPSSPAAASRPGIGQQVRNGNLEFVVTDVETASAVADSADPSVRVEAQGIFVIVKMTVTNASNDPQPFDPLVQQLKAGDGTFSPRRDAQNILGLGDVIDPNDQLDATLAFDVPADNKPESIVLHDWSPAAPGTEVFFD